MTQIERDGVLRRIFQNDLPLGVGLALSEKKRGLIVCNSEIGQGIGSGLAILPIDGLDNKFPDISRIIQFVHFPQFARKRCVRRQGDAAFLHRHGHDERRRLAEQRDHVNAAQFLFGQRVFQNRLEKSQADFSAIRLVTATTPCDCGIPIGQITFLFCALLVPIPHVDPISNAH